MSILLPRSRALTSSGGPCAVIGKLVKEVVFDLERVFRDLSCVT
jgi:hypothetical protein